MALSSTFEADFSGFVAESKKAEAALAGMAAAGATATTSTAKLATANTASTTTLTSMAAQLRVADQSMASFGVSISPVVNAVTELSQVAGKTATEIGAIGTASAVAAAAMAGWNIGRWIADLTGADEAIATFTARVLGLGDVAGEVAANNLELMNRAIGKGFTGAASDFVGASAFLQKAAKDNAKAIQEGADAAEKAAKAQQKLQDQLFGYDLITRAQTYADALLDVSQVAQLSAETQAEVNTVMGAAIDTFTRLGGAASESIQAMYLATLPLPPMVEGLEAAWNAVGDTVSVNADRIVPDILRQIEAVQAYEAETQRLADEWNQVKPPIDAATQSIDATTGATQQLTVEMQNLGRVTMTAWEALQAGKELMAAYREAGVFVGSQIATEGYNASMRRAVSREATAAGAGQAWGNTLTVNVNNADAQGIASKLVTEMRHQGVRF